MADRTLRSHIEDQCIFTTPLTATVRSVCHVMKANRIGAIMVVDEEKRLAGIFTERDAVFRVLSPGVNPDRTEVQQVMTRNPSTLGPDATVDQALRLMQDVGVRHMPIVEDGKPIGMFSLRDALGLELARFEQELRKKQAIAEILA